jgi:hypothetical protein
VSAHYEHLIVAILEHACSSINNEIHLFFDSPSLLLHTRRVRRTASQLMHQQSMLALMHSPAGQL